MGEYAFILLGIGYWLVLGLNQIVIMMMLKKIYKTSHNSIFTVIMNMLVSLILALSVGYIPNLPAVYVIAFICESLLFVICFRFTLLQAYLCSCFYVFHMIALKGIVIGTMSLLLKQNSFQIMCQPHLKYISIILVQVIMFVLLIVYRYKIDARNMRNFLMSRKQSMLVLVCHLTLTIFMLFNSFTFYYNLDLVWISVSQVLTGVILGISYMAILSYGVGIADLLQHKLRDQKQLDTIQYQLRQQNSMLRIEEVLNKFKHDYREQMLSIEYCIDNHKTDEAKEELHRNYIQQLNSLPQTKKYSNNIILNSLFIDCQETCNEKNIDMDVLLFLPPYLSLSEKDCHEMFRILIENAIEANEEVLDRQRYLKVISEVDKSWLSIVVENPYQGIIQFENGRPVSKESKNENEGLGLIYIEEMLLESGDIIQYKVDKEKQIFKVAILLHIENEEESDDNAR